MLRIASRDDLSPFLRSASLCWFLYYKSLNLDLGIKHMNFPLNQPPEKAIPISMRVPASLLQKIDADVDEWNRSHPKSPETRTDRLTYLIDYAYAAGKLNELIDTMRAQYLNILSLTPEQVIAGASTFNQVAAVQVQINDVQDQIAQINSKLECMAR